MTSLKELKLDLEELEKLFATAERTKVKSILEKEIKNLSATIKSATASEETAKASASTTNSSSGAKHYKPIKSFGWDGSSAKTAKIYVNLKGVGTHDTSKVFSKFESRSLEVKVEDFNNANYVFSVVGLSADILPEQCSVKPKGDDIIVTLKKKEEKSWKHLRKCDQEADDKKKKKEAEEKKADSDDPSASIMNMMKKMYDEGDDEMKRTIAKAWTESRDKQSGGLGGGPSGGGLGDMPDL